MTEPKNFDPCFNCGIIDKYCQKKITEELEKIKVEIQAERITDGQVYNGEYFSDDALNINYGISICLDILDKYISELKGETNGQA